MFLKDENIKISFIMEYDENIIFEKSKVNICDLCQFEKNFTPKFFTELHREKVDTFFLIMYVSKSTRNQNRINHQKRNKKERYYLYMYYKRKDPAHPTITYMDPHDNRQKHTHFFPIFHHQKVNADHN